MDRLIIVGNGFDLAHGLNTRYSDFYNTLSEDVKLKWENTYLPAAELIDNWCDFEENILMISQTWFDSYFEKASTGQDTKETEEHMNKIDDAFGLIQKKFHEYLEVEDQREVPLKNSVSKFITKNSQVVTFNYTNLVEAYSDKVIYVHGSLKDRFIIFGYNIRGEQDFTPAIATTFSKSRLRNILEYRKFLIRRELNMQEVEKEINIFRKVNDHSYTGKGGYGFQYGELEESIRKKYQEYYSTEGLLEYNEEYFYLNCLPDELSNKIKQMMIEQSSNLVVEFFNSTQFQTKGQLNDIEYQKIKSLVIMGHSIEADFEIFEEIVGKTVNLETYILFTHKGESRDDLNYKIRKLKDMKDIQVELEYY